MAEEAMYAIAWVHNLVGLSSPTETPFGANNFYRTTEIASQAHSKEKANNCGNAASYG